MRPQTLATCVVCAMAALTGCATYRPAPIDSKTVLKQLEAVEWTGDPSRQPEAGDEVAGVGPRELAAFAVQSNPRLAAARARLGVSAALLVEAGLLPDPTLSWGAMDVVASEIVQGSSSSLEVLSGIGLSFPLLRPGERDARVGAAEWRVEEVRRRVIASEWSLTREIHLAYEEVRGAESLLAQSSALVELAGSTSDYFERAKQAGAATAIQANLALGQLQSIRLDTVNAKSRVMQARQALNGLLGLPPTAAIVLLNSDDPSVLQLLDVQVTNLVEQAVSERPDLAAFLADYEVAEEEVRLAFSKQFPLVTVGTGLGLTLPFFSKFGGPAMRTAIARRSQLALEFTGAVHTARQEVAAAHTLWELANSELELIDTELLPNAEQNLQLSQEAFQAGEVTLLETLALQRALVEARTRRTEVRAEKAKRAWSLLAASGLLLVPANSSDTNNEGQPR